MWSKVEVWVLPSFSLMKPSELLCSVVTQTNKLWYIFSPLDICIDVNFQNGVGFFPPLNTSCLINFPHSPRMTVTKPDWQFMIGPFSMHVWDVTHPVSIWSFWRVESGAQNWWSGRQRTCQVIFKLYGTCVSMRRLKGYVTQLNAVPKFSDMIACSVSHDVTWNQYYRLWRYVPSCHRLFCENFYHSELESVMGVNNTWWMSVLWLGMQQWGLNHFW